MKILGILTILAVFIASAYFSFFTEVGRDRISSFAGVGIICGVGLIIAERITAVKALGIGLEAAVEKAQADVEQIEAIRREVEAQRDSIALITRDANIAREQLDDVEKLAQDTRVRAEQIEAMVRQAERTAHDANAKAENIIRVLQDLGR